MHVLYRITRGMVPLGAKLERLDSLNGSPFPCPNPRCNSSGFLIDPDAEETMQRCDGEEEAVPGRKRRCNYWIRYRVVSR